MLFPQLRLKWAIRARAEEEWRRLRGQGNTRCVDLKEPKLLGPDHDQREYVGAVGFFTEDMMFEDIPHLIWYCRRDGNIWAEWQLRLKESDPL